MNGERLMATSRRLIVAGQQVNRNRGLLVNVPLARLIATESLVKVSNQRIQQNIQWTTDSTDWTDSHRFSYINEI